MRKARWLKIGGRGWKGVDKGHMESYFILTFKGLFKAMLQFFYCECTLKFFLSGRIEHRLIKIQVTDVTWQTTTN